MSKKSKVLVLFSGGLDSTTLLYQAITNYGRENVAALSMYYGQRHIKEQECAEKICKDLGIPRYVKDLTTIFEFSKSSMLAQGVDVPEGNYADQLQDATFKDEHGNINSYVPFRNGLFLSVATAIAYSLNYDIVYYGAHADDAAGEAYPDCSENFVNSMQLSISLGTGSSVLIEAPFISCHKADIVHTGLELGVPFENTWSCYEGGKFPCHKCGTCVDRERAFIENDETDPLIIQEKRHAREGSLQRLSSAT